MLQPGDIEELRKQADQEGGLLFWREDSQDHVLHEEMRRRFVDLIDAFSETVKWVPVSERTPEDGQVVLCYWPTDPPSMQSLTYLAADAPDSRDAWRDLFDNDEDDPSHWMTLPEAPK